MKLESLTIIFDLVMGECQLADLLNSRFMVEMLGCWGVRGKLRKLIKAQFGSRISDKVRCQVSGCRLQVLG